MAGECECGSALAYLPFAASSADDVTLTPTPTCTHETHEHMHRLNEDPHERKFLEAYVLFEEFLKVQTADRI